MEGCYIPFDWPKDFDQYELTQIRFYCLVMSERYIRNHFADIKAHASDIERRLNDDWCTMESVLEENAKYRDLACIYGLNCILIDDQYNVEVEL